MSSKALRLSVFVSAGLAAWVLRRIGRRPRPARVERVLILGGSRGLGLLIAREYLRRGSRVVLAARDERELADAVGTLRGASRIGDEVSAVRCDVEREDDVRSAVEAARARLGGVDVLVNNAGIIEVGPLDAMSLEDFDRSLRVHLRGPLVASLAVIGEMRARRFGRIVNIASIGALVPIPHLLPYVASKFALAGLSQGLRVELAKDGISVTTVCPGLMRTGSSYRATFKGQHTREHAWFALGGATPLTSMSAPSAARKIVDAAEKGRALVVLSWQARLLVRLYQLAPEATLGALAWVDRLLPSFGGIAKSGVEGRHSTSRWAPSLLTRLNDRAAHDFGELGRPELSR